MVFNSVCESVESLAAAAIAAPTTLRNLVLFWAFGTFVPGESQVARRYNLALARLSKILLSCYEVLDGS